MNEELRELARDAIIKEQNIPWREAMIQRNAVLGMAANDKLELRVTGDSNEHIVALACRATSVFLTAFMLYPTSLAMHPANAAVCEAAEEIIKAQPAHGNELIMMMLGNGFTPSPLHIEADDSLGLHCVAVRFAINQQDPAFQKALVDSLMRTIQKKK